jgi:hypothetical protein
MSPGHPLHRKLSSFGVLLLTLSCLSPVFSIYGVGSDVLLHAGTGAAGMFICGIGVALVWAVPFSGARVLWRSRVANCYFAQRMRHIIQVLI